MWNALLSALTGLVVRLLALFAAWRAGQNSVRAEINAKGMENARKANAIEMEVARLSADELHSELLGRTGR